MKGGGLSALLENVVHERRRSQVLEAPLVVPRRGVMLHYDDSSRDEWALAWFADPRCKNGYTWVVLDDGRIVEIADPVKRTPHAGACRTVNANSAFYGIAATTNGKTLATEAQLASIVTLVTTLCWYHAWPFVGGIPVVGHDEQAIWTPTTTRGAGMSDDRGQKLWGKGGRKVDPTGTRSDGVPIIDVNHVREDVFARLLREVENEGF